MSGTNYKSLIGEEDLSLWDGGSNSTFTRMTSTGSPITMTRFGASGNINLLASDVMTKYGPVVDIRAWGAGENGSTDDTVPFRDALAALSSSGGIIDARGVSGNRQITGQIEITTPGTTILFGPVTYTLSGVGATQSPIGAVWLASSPAHRGKMLGFGTKFIMADACQASAICLNDVYGWTIDGIELDGNKAGNDGQSDDTWQSAITAISTSGDNATNSAHRFTNLNIHDWVHYGVLMYGDTCSGNLVQGCKIYDNGIVGDAISLGIGVCINYGSTQNRVIGNEITGNKLDGVQLCNAGNSGNIVGTIISGNNIHTNSRNGVWILEQSDYNSSGALGCKRTIVSGNELRANTVAGVRCSTADAVGAIDSVVITGNAITENQYGVLLTSSNDATNNTRNVVIAGNEINGNDEGVTVGSNVLDTLIEANRIVGNTSANITDNGTYTLSAGNKTTAADGYFRAGYGTFSGTVTSPLFLVTSGSFQANEVGVRQWDISAASGNLKIDSGDDAGYVYMKDTGGPIIPSITTANLPAADAARNGLVVIENNGTGDGNLIIYVGAQRFRIDGGSAF